MGIEPGLRDQGLEQLDRVAGRVFDQDLLAANPGHDLVAEMRSGAAQPLHQRIQVIDLQREAVPAAGLLLGAVRHRLPAAALRVGCAEHQAQLTPGQHRKCRGRVHHQLEFQPFSVEADGRFHIPNDITDLYCRHFASLLDPACREPHLAPGSSNPHSDGFIITLFRDQFTPISP